MPDPARIRERRAGPSAVLEKVLSIMVIVLFREHLVSLGDLDREADMRARIIGAK